MRCYNFVFQKQKELASSEVNFCTMNILVIITAMKGQHIHSFINKTILNVLFNIHGP